ncbi:MAG: hypothetical protein PHV34_23775 [Verrucomicrobiae bacterium]|nr:hypothetical protein [Verrucomicrobiae bacterium]
MREAMLNHGLDEPTIEQRDGFFVVTLLVKLGIAEKIGRGRSISHGQKGAT